MKRSTLSRMGAWILLGLALVLAGVLWQLGTRPISQGGSRVFGGGTGNVSRSEAHTNWLLIGAALAIGVAGTAGWAMSLLRQGRDGARTVLVAGIAIGLVALATWGITDRLRADDVLPAHGPRYESIAEVAEVLEGSRVECKRLTLRETPAPYARPERGACEIERRLALDDGLETVFIQLWRNSDARSEWYENVSAADVVSVDGPTWLITCEFETTCTQIQLVTGGRIR